MDVHGGTTTGHAGRRRRLHAQASGLGGNRPCPHPELGPASRTGDSEGLWFKGLRLWRLLQQLALTPAVLTAQAPCPFPRGAFQDGPETRAPAGPRVTWRRGSPPAGAGPRAHPSNPRTRATQYGLLPCLAWTRRPAEVRPCARGRRHRPLSRGHVPGHTCRSLWGPVPGTQGKCRGRRLPSDL